jgi:endonuclease YncB( thermonuclease family)
MLLEGWARVAGQLVKGKTHEGMQLMALQEKAENAKIGIFSKKVTPGRILDLSSSDSGDFKLFG